MVTATLTTVLDGLVVASSLLLLPLLARQKLTYFRPVRGYLVLGYLLIVVWACLDFTNLLIGTEASGLLYTLAGVPAILLATLPLLSWMIAAVLLVALRLYFPPGTLASRMASAIGIVVFGMTAYVFRRTDVLAGFVAQHAASLPASTPSHPFSRRLRLGSLEEL